MDISCPVAQSWGSGRASGRAAARLLAGMSSNRRRYQMAELGPLTEEIVLAHFIVSDDVERSRCCKSPTQWETRYFGCSPHRIHEHNSSMRRRLRALRSHSPRTDERGGRSTLRPRNG